MIIIITLTIIIIISKKIMMGIKIFLKWNYEGVVPQLHNHVIVHIVHDIIDYRWRA